MEARVHILCSHCEKVLVEVPKEKIKDETTSNLKVASLENNLTCNEQEITEMSTSDDEEHGDDEHREIEIDYGYKSKNPTSVSKQEFTGNPVVSRDCEKGFADSTLKKLEPAIEKIRRLTGYGFYFKIKKLHNV